jgi:low temperature requirement protein LtrA
MAADPTWHGVAQGLLVLAVLWWTWVGYSWLTSVVDPEAGSVRLVMFAAMAALLVLSLCVPRAFDDEALLFAVAYAVVRVAHIALFLLASRDEPELRRSVLGLAVGTAIGIALLFGAAAADGALQGILWGLAIVLDTGGPFLFGQDGWKLMPGHFAERHGLIVLIALGESIVAIGVGAEHGVDAGVAVASVLGMAVAAAIWWLYFDVVAIAAARRLERAAEGHERNGVARDSYSYLHFPIVAGIVLIAFGLKTTLAHVGDPLPLVPAVALLGGTTVHLLGHVAFRLRNIGSLNRHRLTAAVVAAALIPAGTALPALATLAILTAGLVVLLAYETIHFRERRAQLRAQLAR